MSVYTKLLLHCNGTDGSQVFTDEKGKTVTANGNAQIDTAQSVFGGASGLFDGAGGYLSLADSNDWNFGAGDFTIDFRMRLNNIGSAMTFFSQPNAIGITPLLLLVETNGYLYLYGSYAGTAWNILELDTELLLVINTWYHVAVVRYGTSLKVYVDGVAVTDFNIGTNNLFNCDRNLFLGAYTEGGYFLNGWMDEIRISKGIARWTANFAPPTKAYSIASGIDDIILLQSQIDKTILHESPFDKTILHESPFDKTILHESPLH